MEELSSVAFMFGSGKTFDSSGNVIRNRLNLAQRIEVIKQFQKTPSIGHLANLFKCGRRQIKNILRKRRKYLTMWTREKNETNTSSGAALDTAVGRVLYEWVQRARCYQINITNEILRSFAKEIADHINFNFEPSNVWVIKFKEKYNIERELKVKHEAGLENRKPLSISVIIDDLRREHGYAIIPSGDDLDEIQLLDDMDSDPEESKKKTSSRNCRSESIDSAVHMEADRREMMEMGADGYDAEGSSLVPAKEIATYREALNQLGPLEQFALLKEHIRAVGLINQLENLLQEEMVKDELR